ncbi:hypothetical protein HYN56_08280 [Flavobacterium crocinum]|uniref:Uncharacterized protein n=1 Tax=Flavobacterium crocinum TaxID=2183896 RepID=A0A2S1YJI1_9FLAO|nr:hypothetical protein [Flavobacterium crocinum]AWK04230.1 hypothetical protein HYN56_08280 [Flavobacterium crocinum]
MKKLIFTAFAVVMFSSISTAKTAEVLKDCSGYAATKTNADESKRETDGRGCYSSGQYNKIYQIYKMECEMSSMMMVPLEEEEFFFEELIVFQE